MDVADPLNYAPAPPRRHRYVQAIRRLILFAGAAAIVCFWRPPAWRWADFLYCQHRCLSYTAAPAHLVFQCDLPTHQVLYSELNPIRTRFEDFGSGRSRWTFPTIFLHQLSRPGGSDRLISLSVDQLYLSSKSGKFSLRLDDEQWPISTFLARRPPTGADREIILDIPRSGKRLEIFAAQLDPADPTHFTFAYDLDAHPHIVDGWLTNADELLLSARP